MSTDSQPLVTAVQLVEDGADTESQESSAPLPSVPFDEAVRIVEAMLFVSDEPLTAKTLVPHIGDALEPVMEHLKQRYATSGVNLVEVAGGYALRTASDLSYLFEEQASEPKKLSRAALETLAIIAYHQPVTRAEIEEIRGVSASKGTLDVLLETGWVRMRGRRRTPGRPVTYGTTPAFLDQFTLASVGDLPGLDELKGAGLLDAIPQGALSAMPAGDADQLSADEDPLDDEDAATERSAMALWPQDELEQSVPDTSDEQRDADG
jgi:segregation and condensation protein B